MIFVFWVVTQRGFVGGYRCFGEKLSWTLYSWRWGLHTHLFLNSIRNHGPSVRAVEISKPTCLRPLWATRYNVLSPSQTGIRSALHFRCQLHATVIGDVSPAENLTWLPTCRRELKLSITGNAWRRSDVRLSDYLTLFIKQSLSSEGADSVDMSLFLTQPQGSLPCSQESASGP
jgi:hypothetical protein